MQEQNTQPTPVSRTKVSMTMQVITIYCVCDDFLQASDWRDDAQARMTTAEVMTVSLVAAAIFDGNQEKSRRFLKEHGYIPAMLSKSQFNRRWHSIPETLWQEMLWVLGQAAQHTNPEKVYAVDSVPVPVCHNIRIRRSRLIHRSRLYPLRAWGKEYRGYCASKKSYYYGLKGHLLITADGRPVEFVLTPASAADIVGFRRLDLDLPANAYVMADAAYTDYEYEDLLREQEQITLLADRKCNSKRPHPAHLRYLCQMYRKRIETTFSTLTGWLGRRLHAVTPQGWERKVFLTVLAYALLA